MNEAQREKSIRQTATQWYFSNTRYSNLLKQRDELLEACKNSLPRMRELTRTYEQVFGKDHTGTFHDAIKQLSAAITEATRPMNKTNTTTTLERKPELRAWAVLAEEALADAGYWKRATRDARDQRDELLETCKCLMDELRHGQNVPSNGVMDAIRFAIAKAEGPRTDEN